ncbi:MAG: hypothetical protein WBD37_15740 [Anderseniella sp.]
MPHTKSRVLVLDPDFEHDGGHNYVTNQILAGRVKSEVRIMCPVTLTASVNIQGAELCRAFPRNSYVLEESLSILEQIALKLRLHNPVGKLQAEMRDAFATAISGQLADMNASSRDSILIHTGSCFLFDALLQALEKWPSDSWPALHLRQLRPVADLEKAAFIHQRLRECRRNTDVYMYAETDAFAAQLGKLGHQTSEIEKLEISDLGRSLSPSPAIQNFVEVAVLGTVRREKGHGRLEAIGRAYHKLSKIKSLPILMFNIHTGAIKNGRLFKRMVKGLDRWNINYSLHKQSADVAGHWQCLAGSHIVLIPYEADRYTDRGSGVCIDAIAHGRPLIVSGRCTLEEYLRGGNGLSAESEEEFAQRIAQIAESHKAFAEGSLQLASEFRARQKNHPLFARLDATFNSSR